ncbi:MAG: hypothetical protein ACI8RD_010510, partial [Bacillariaceae sp.]
TQADNDSFFSFVPEETPLESISEKALDDAKELIRIEYDRSMQDKRAQSILLDRSNSAKEIFVLNTWKDPKNDSKLLTESLTQEFDTLQEATSILHKKNEKTESKLTLLTGGFTKRAQHTSAKISQIYHDLQNTVIEKAIYLKLREQEELGAVARIDRLRSSIASLKDDEERLIVVLNSLKTPE